MVSHMRRLLLPPCRAVIHRIETLHNRTLLSCIGTYVSSFATSESRERTAFRTAEEEAK